MAGLKDVIAEKVVSPSVNNDGDHFGVEAIVRTIDADNSTCTITYRSGEGRVTRENVLVRTGSVSFVDWFPEKGDHVLVNIINGRHYVTGPSDAELRGMRKRNSRLASDIYSDMTATDTQGGWIF